MSTITGRLMFDRNRTALPSALLSGIANVAIVLQNIDTNATLGVLTNESGEYTFNNVPNGNYQIVESYGFTPATVTPGDFLNASPSIILAGGITPPISFVNSPPVGATNLDCTIPNTLHVIINNSDLTNIDLLNGPVMYSPISLIMDESVVVLPHNLITNADNGTFGSYHSGEKANTGASPNPYTNLGTDFIYALPASGTVRPTDGEYTIQNIMNEFIEGYTTWWVIADHTYGNEAGRMMVINGDNPGAIIFKEIVTVKPQTYYLFSAWILNIIKQTFNYALPALGVAIMNERGEDLYREILGNQIPARSACPEWKQIGTVIRSGENTSLTIEFISMGPRAIGNDYVIDDIILNEVELVTYQPIKTVDKSVVNINEIIIYTITLNKPGKEPLTNVRFTDILPEGIIFIPDSVVINGLNTPGVNPNVGFSVSDILGDTTLTVSFSARVDSVPEPNPTLNKAHITYSYSPIEGGISDIYEVDTNEASVKVLVADLSLTKTTEIVNISPGEYLIYNLTIHNLGPDTADNVTINDILPNSLTSATFSVDNGISWDEWMDSFTVSTLVPNQSIAILIKALVKENVIEPIINTATIDSDTSDPNDENNSSKTETAVTVSADLSLEKIAQPLSVRPGEEILYTLEIRNLGPNEAKDVVITDIIPPELSNAQYFIGNETSWKDWTGSIVVGTIASQNSASILIRAKVNPNAAGIITNTSRVESTTPDSNLENNTSTITTIIITPMQDLLADLEIIKSSSPNPCIAGDLLTYTLRITNNGPDEAVDVTLIDTISTYIPNPRFSIDNGVTWQQWNGSYFIESLENQASVTILISGTVSSSAIGTISNNATILSTTPDPNPENNIAYIENPIISIADITVTKTASANIISIGESLSYTITIFNNGPANVQNVIVTDIIPSSLTNVEYSIDRITWSRWNGFHTISNLENNQSYTITIRGTVSATANGEIKNTVIVRSPVFDPDLENNEAAATTEVEGLCDLSIVKRVSSCAAPCKPLIYKITISNAGPNRAEDVIMTDHISGIISKPIYSNDNGLTWHKWEGTLSVGSLDANSTITILIKGTIKRCTCGKIKNTASVTSRTHDINSTNNKSTVITKILS